MDTRGIFVKPFHSPDDEDFGEGLCYISVHPLSVWNVAAPTAGQDYEPPGEAECFTVREPCMIDVLKLAGDSLHERRQFWRAWESSP